MPFKKLDLWMLIKSLRLMISDDIRKSKEGFLLKKGNKVGIIGTRLSFIFLLHTPCFSLQQADYIIF